MSLPTAKARLLSHIAAAITASLLALALYWTADRFLDRNVQPISSSPSTTDNYLPNLGPDWGTQHVNLDRYPAP